MKGIRMARYWITMKSARACKASGRLQLAGDVTEPAGLWRGSGAKADRGSVML